MNQWYLKHYTGLTHNQFMVHCNNFKRNVSAFLGRSEDGKITFKWTNRSYVIIYQTDTQDVTFESDLGKDDFYLVSDGKRYLLKGTNETNKKFVKQFIK